MENICSLCEHAHQSDIWHSPIAFANASCRGYFFRIIAAPNGNLVGADGIPLIPAKRKRVSKVNSLLNVISEPFLCKDQTAQLGICTVQLISRTLVNAQNILCNFDVHVKKLDDITVAWAQLCPSPHAHHSWRVTASCFLLLMLMAKIAPSVLLHQRYISYGTVCLKSNEASW